MLSEVKVFSNRREELVRGQEADLIFIRANPQHPSYPGSISSLDRF
jgi:hypothetical protein